MKEEKTYTCVCGKSFDNGRSLQVHKINCKDWKQHKAQQEEIARQEREARRLPNGLFKCDNPDCTNEHDGSYGSGRFCCKKCKDHLAALNSAKTAKKNGTRKCNFNSPNSKYKRKPYGTWKCERCNLIFETRAQLFEHNHQVHPIEKGSSWNKGLTKETDERVAKYCQTTRDRLDAGIIQPSMKGKHLSEEHKNKTSASMKKFFKEHPDRVPYVLNHSSKESYPEKYFKSAFLAENFPVFIQDKYVNGYFLDFAFDKLKLYIEVDGEQHYTDKKIVQHDLVRTANLNKTEWKCICRIRWSKFQRLTVEQKHKFILGLKNKLFKNVPQCSGNTRGFDP